MRLLRDRGRAGAGPPRGRERAGPGDPGHLSMGGGAHADPLQASRSILAPADAGGGGGRLLAGAPRRAAPREGVRSRVRVPDGAGTEDPAHAHLPRADAARRRARPAVQRDGEDPGGGERTGAAAESYFPREGGKKNSAETTRVAPSRSLEDDKGCRIPESDAFPL